MNNESDNNLLKLYVHGITSNSTNTISNIQSLCKNELKNRYKLVIIDILESPQFAIEDEVLITPTLIKTSPVPSRRIVGDLSDNNKILECLGLTDNNL